jgi:hypothetical protein
VLVTALTGVGLAGLAVAAMVQEPVPRAWLPPAILAGFCALCCVLSTPRLRNPLVALLSWSTSARLQGAALLALGPILAVAIIVQADPIELDSTDYQNLTGQGRSLEEVTEGQPFTDAGRPIRIFLPEGAPGTSQELMASESGVLARPGIKERFIRVGDADPSHNCHGWIFTGGRYWVKGNDVPVILADNGYTLVSQPEEHDLIIYRDARGACIHSGIVRTVSGDLLLIESKWGKAGRFIHPPEVQFYGTQYAFYRSPRLGHRLRGLGQQELPSLRGT